MSGKHVITEIEQRVARLTLNRPERRNAFHSPMFHELRGALETCLERDTIGAVVITGAGEAFTAGQDLGEMANLSEKAARDHGFAGFMDVLCRFDKPLIAAVNGVGVGLGLTLLLHCDLVFMARKARLRPPFVALGVVPEAASSYLLPSLIGFQRAAEIFYSAEWIDADRALELGIASRVLARDELLPAAMQRAAQIARQPLAALRRTKQLLLATRAEQVDAARAREDAAFRERIGTPENLEAIRAFFEKREPDFAQWAASEPGRSRGEA